VPVNMLPTGIAESKTLHARRFTLDAFPNPFRGTTTIRLSDSPLVPNPSSFTVRVFDATGRLIECASLGPKLPLAVSFGGSVRPGIYFATVGTGSAAATCRIVKMP